MGNEMNVALIYCSGGVRTQIKPELNFAQIQSEN